MNLNNFKSLFKGKLHIGSATVFLSIIFLFTFCVGIYIGRIDPLKDLDTVQFVLLGIILVILFPIVGMLTGFIVNAEARRLSGDRLKNKQKEIDKKDREIDNLITAHQRRLSIIYNVKEFIDESENHIKDENLSDLRMDLVNQISELQKEEEAAKDILSWLSEQKNKVVLMQYATKEAMSALKLKDSSPYKRAIEIFKKDIYRCITWLQASLAEGFPLKVTASKLASSAYRLPGELDNHKNALHAIEKHPIILEKAKESITLNTLIDDLIYDLENEIKSDKAIRLTHISQRSSR